MEEVKYRFLKQKYHCLLQMFVVQSANVYDEDAELTEAVIYYVDENTSAKKVLYRNNAEKRFINEVLNGSFYKWTNRPKQLNTIKRTLNVFKDRAIEELDQNFNRTAKALETRIREIDLISGVDQVIKGVSDRREAYFAFNLMQELISAKLILNKYWNWDIKGFRAKYGERKTSSILSLYQKKHKAFRDMKAALKRYLLKKRGKKDTTVVIIEMEALYNRILQRRRMRAQK